MTNPLLSLAVIASLLSSCSSAPPPKRAGTPPYQTAAFAAIDGTIVVQITGIPRIEGQLFVELYDRSTWFHYQQVLEEKLVPVSGTTMAVVLEHVPPGRYVVAVSHDANSNHQLDTGLFGYPTEAYGFSRGARGLLGPPDFEVGAFDFAAGRLEVPVAIR